MSDMFSGDITNADGLQISAIFGFMNPEYHEAVVKHVLDSRSKVVKRSAGIAQFGYKQHRKSTAVPKRTRQGANALSHGTCPESRDHIRRANGRGSESLGRVPGRALRCGR